MSETAAEYTLLIVESPTLATRLQDVAPDHVYVFATGGFLWKPEFDPIRGKLSKKAVPDQLDRRNELRREAKYAIKIIIATDSDPSGDFIAWTIYKELSSARILRGHLRSVSQSSIMQLIRDAVTVDFLILHKRLENRFKIRHLWVDVYTNINMRDAGLLALFGEPVEMFEFQTASGIVLQSECSLKTKISNQQIKLKRSSEDGWIHQLPLSTFAVVVQLLQLPDSGSYSAAQELLQKTFEATNPDTGEGLITYPRTGNRSFFPDTWQILQQQWTAKQSINTFLPVSLRNVTPVDDAHDAIRPVNLNLTPEWVENHLPSDIGRVYRLIYNHTIQCIKMPAPAEATYHHAESGFQLTSQFPLDEPEITVRPFLSVSELGYSLCRLGVLRPSGFGSFIDETIHSNKIMVDLDGGVSPGPALLSEIKPNQNFSSILTNLQSVADDPTLTDETIRSILSS